MTTITTKQKWIIGILAVILLVIIILLFVKRKAIKVKVWDLLSEAKILTLHPKVREQARAFLNKAEKEGIKLRITAGRRTDEEQNKLYAQGRSEPGGVVTNAKAGQSSHNFATAIDVVPIVNGAADWNTPHWNKIAAIGKSVGFSWGGDWTSFKDKPHFEKNFGLSLAELRGKSKGADGYIQLAYFGNEGTRPSFFYSEAA